MAADVQTVHDLLEELDDLLDPDSTLRHVNRAYTKAISRMDAAGRAPEELAELARLLRRTADIADQLAAARP